MNRKNFILVAIWLLFFSYCDRSPNSSSGESYLVFGRFYGECVGESCIEFFKIENNKLYEDTLDYYPAQNNLPHNTSYLQLPDETYEKVKHLPALIPDELFLEGSVVIGQPDAGDWGGFYLETDQSGTIKTWLIDKNKNNIPEYLHAYVDSLDQAIETLQ